VPFQYALVRVLRRQNQASPVGRGTGHICRAYCILYVLRPAVRKSAARFPDLTQEFFCRLLKNAGWIPADRDAASFRTFLIVSAENFMNTEWRRASAQPALALPGPCGVRTRPSPESRLAVDTQPSGWKELPLTTLVLDAAGFGP